MADADEHASREIKRPRARRAPKDQIPTIETTAAWIMSQAAFQQGVEDRRAGRPMSSSGDIAHAWQYERGRLWASLAPADMPLRIGGKLNPRALALLEAAFDRKLVL
jgi:hypothetical protein